MTSQVIVDRTRNSVEEGTGTRISRIIQNNESEF